MINCEKNFEESYVNNILPKYGKPRNSEYDDYLLNSSTNLPNIYDKIIDKHRLNLTDIMVYSIDPEGCMDADDAFSIWVKDNKLFLSIHIADPTYYIEMNSMLWHDILKRAITHYPSNNKPINMLPQNILEKSSLMTEDDNKQLNAITITFEIDKMTMLPIDNINLEFTKINVISENKLTYMEAGNLLNTCLILQQGCEISQNLKKLRSEKTLGTKLSELNFIKPKFINGKISLFGSNESIYESIQQKNEIMMQEMIAEFAILTNSYIGTIIQNNLNNSGIFRSCIADFSLKSEQNKLISAEDILQKIIKDGIHAEYTALINSKHDLVGTDAYCHFTSPMRRVTDCVCHYLIKAYFVEKSLPWTVEELDNIAKYCHDVTKKEKSIQYHDYKFRVIQLLSELVKNNKIMIGVKINQYTGLFLNCTINKIMIDNHNNVMTFNTNISYSLRGRDFKFNNMQCEEILIEIKNINILGKFDEGTLPDLDIFLRNNYM